MDQSVGVLEDDGANVVAVAVRVGRQMREEPIAATGRWPTTHIAASMAWMSNDTTKLPPRAMSLSQTSFCKRLSMVAVLGGSGRPPSIADGDDLRQLAQLPLADQLGHLDVDRIGGIW